MVLDGELIARLAGPRSYARGAAYFRDRRVELGEVGSERVAAVVRGSMPYRVELRVRGGDVEWSCSCPVGETGEFCKHAVAVALAAGAERAAPPSAASRGDDGLGEGDARTIAASLSRAELIELASRQLASKAGEGRGGRRRDVTPIGEQAWSRMLESAFAAGDGFVSYREAAWWAGRINDVLHDLEHEIPVDPGTVLVVAEHAHRLADAAIQYVDDSDGWLTDISGRIGEIHLQACRLATPDPVGLAARLVDLELTSELDTFHRAAATYAEVLGDAGLDEYRRRIEPRWRKLGSRSDRWSSTRFRLQESMTAIALASGDPDELIRVKSKDTRLPDDYIEIAVALRTAGRDDEALEWARTGLDQHEDRLWQTGPLMELLAEMLRDRGASSGAVDVFRRAFDRHPSVSSYRRLVAEATHDGSVERVAADALDALAERVGKYRQEETPRGSLATTAPATALIEILTYEGRIDEAWNVAIAHGAPDHVWMTLARAREHDHPGDVIPVYERQINAHIDMKKNTGYQAAVDLLDRLAGIADRAGASDRFAQFVADIRTRHKAKRNLMALLDQRTCNP